MVNKVPGHMMADESYTLTQVQIDALNAMPPGVYLVCFQCRRFNPMATSVYFDGGDAICESCHKWGGAFPKKVNPNE